MIALLDNQGGKPCPDQRDAAGNAIQEQADRAQQNGYADDRQRASQADPERGEHAGSTGFAKLHEQNHLMDDVTVQKPDCNVRDAVKQLGMVLDRAEQDWIHLRDHPV